MYHWLNEFAINECLRLNRDKASLIFFPDTDETFFPSRLTSFDYVAPRRVYDYLSASSTRLASQEEANAFSRTFLSSHMCNQDKITLKNYLSSIYTKYSIRKESSLFIPQVFFLHQRLAEVIVGKLEASLNETLWSKNATSVQDIELMYPGLTLKYPLTVPIFLKHTPHDTQGLKFHSAEWDTNFSIQMSDASDVTYAANLVSVYKRVIRPFLDENQSRLSGESERLARVLYLDLSGDRETASYVGKTFVNPTSSEFMLNPHVPDHQAGLLYGRDKSDLYNVPPNQNREVGSYYLAHFRDRYKMGQMAKSIKRFNLDLNYFACYVKPLVLGWLGRWFRSW